MLKVRIDRARWLHARNKKTGGSSMLLRRSDNRMCCLGFACLAAGLTEADIVGVTVPIRLPQQARQQLPSEWFSESAYATADLIAVLVAANDTIEVDATRERAVIKDGKALDIDFEFYGEYDTPPPAGAG